MTRRLFLSTFTILLALSAVVADDTIPSDSDHIDLRSRDLILAKIWCLIVVLVGTLIAGVSPYFVKWNPVFLTLGTQFAGGVFLGTALMHFLSDANEKFGDLTTKTYPFAFMLASAGYLLTMLADSVIFFIYRTSEDRFHNDIEIPGSLNGRITTDLQSKEQHIRSATVIASSLADSVFLIIALCFHSVFEGIAIGVSESRSDAWRALWTICLHKIFAAIAMGIALLRMIPNRPFLSCASYALAFAISTPVGVAIGIVIDATSQGKAADWIFAVSMGLACGVFVYVSINQLISKGCATENMNETAPFLKFLAVLLGVGIIAVVMIWDT